VKVKSLACLTWLPGVGVVAESGPPVQPVEDWRPGEVEHRDVPADRAQGEGRQGRSAPGAVKFILSKSSCSFAVSPVVCTRNE